MIAAVVLSVATLRPPYRGDVASALAWVDRQQLTDGAILYGANEIEPYYATIAATGMLVERAQLPRVRAWMNWYVTHLNERDRWGLSGTMYDYRYARGVETSLHKADSVDSYAATFFTLARGLYDTGDSSSRAYVLSIRPQLERMGAMLRSPRVLQRDGMTVALPSYPVAYLMDNCEVFRGFEDLAYLERTAYRDANLAREYQRAALGSASGVASLWSSANGTYDYAKQEPGGPYASSAWTTWYPDATAQLFPALQGVIQPRSARAEALWAAFNLAWPQWDRLENGDPGGFPWALVGLAATGAGDDARAATYVRSVEELYAARGFPYPWYDAEGGWYLRTLSALLRAAPREPGPAR